MVAPGEGELTAARRLLERLLPRLHKSLDLIVGAALYCCRPFFQTVCGAGLEGLALSSGKTEMDEEIDLLRKTDPRAWCRGSTSPWGRWKARPGARTSSGTSVSFTVNVAMRRPPGSMKATAGRNLDPRPDPSRRAGMEGGAIPLEDREWNLQRLDAGSLPHPPLPS